MMRSLTRLIAGVRFKPGAAGCGLGLIAFCLMARPAHGQYDPDWARHFRVGMLVGFNIKADFKITGPLNTNPNKPGFYDDGYVVPEPGASPGSFTPNWGYNSASQYDAGAQTLTMHQTTAFTVTQGGSATEDGSPFVGIDLEYGGNLWYWKDLRFGYDIGLGLLPIKMTDRQPMTATSTSQAFSFSTQSPDLFIFPEPGYHGNPGGSGASIPTTATPLPPINTPGVPVTGSRTLDTTFYTVRLGPSVFWDMNQHIGFSLGAGPAVGIVSGEYRFDEKIGTAPNKGKFSATDVVYGGYVSAMATFHAVERGDIYLGVQYMPLSDASFSSGNRQARLNLGGAMYISAGVNWPF